MNYNTYPQQQYFQQQNNLGYTNSYRPAQYPWLSAAAGSMQQVRPVSSIEEVKAYPIDFDGSMFYFPDVANKRIYTKVINNDGTATINLYELKELTSADQSPDSSYVTKEELEKEINMLKESFEALLINVQKTMTQKEEDVQPIAAQPTSINKSNFNF